MRVAGGCPVFRDQRRGSRRRSTCRAPRGGAFSQTRSPCSRAGWFPVPAPTGSGRRCCSSSRATGVLTVIPSICSAPVAVLSVLDHQRGSWGAPAEFVRLGARSRSSSSGRLSHIRGTATWFIAMSRWSCRRSGRPGPAGAEVAGQRISVMKRASTAVAHGHSPPRGVSRPGRARTGAGGGAVADARWSCGRRWRRGSCLRLRVRRKPGRFPRSVAAGAALIPTTRS